MARELGMNPQKLGRLDNHDQVTWKAPLPRFIEQLDEKRFGRTRPDVVVTMEQRMAALREKKEERRAKKKLARELSGGTASPPSPTPAPPTPAIDARPEVTTLFANVKASNHRGVLSRALLPRGRGPFREGTSGSPAEPAQ